MEFKPGVSMRVQVADDLRRRIQTGEWKANDRLPGVFKLCDEYGCSMEVVRQAERILVGEG
jgi:DNA-binding GntR family transcriptional regulator